MGGIWRESRFFILNIEDITNVEVTQMIDRTIQTDLHHSVWKRACTMNHSLRNILFAAAFVVVGPAHATFFSNSTGLATYDRLIDFESVDLDQNEPVTDQFESLGVTFETTFGNPGVDPYPNFSGNRVGNFQSGIIQNSPFKATFSETLRGVAFAYVSDLAVSSFQVLMNGVLVASAVAPTTFNSTTNYFGFKDVEFNQLTITVESSNRVFMMDNLQLAAVPEPASFAMLSLGLVLLGTVAHRSKRSTRV